MRSRPLGLLVGLTAVLAMSSTGADARRHQGGHRMHAGVHRHAPRLVKHAALAGTSSPAFAAMVVDAGSGRTLYAAHENELRHPASITKVMTLYLLFEKLESGDLTLGSRIPVSAHAASMAPTKLGLRPGSTIRVDDAIGAIVTKSANDMAVAVAEAVGGDEDSFATMMTRKARAIGMGRTIYVNASGLPDDRQITTARDLTVLGRSIREQFPQYYHYFSIPSFRYGGSVMPNHNHLMARVDGMDGIKTGYTRASGFNLLSSVTRNGHHLVSVVLGGRSAASRDTIMASLIEQHIEDAAPTRVADMAPPSPVEEAAPTPVPVASENRVAQTDDRGAALIAPTFAVSAAGRPNDRARTPGQLVPAAGIPAERARPAFIAGARPDGGDRLRDGSTGSRLDRTVTTASVPSSTPSSVRPTPRPVQLASLVPIPTARPESAAPRSRADDSRPTPVAARPGSDKVIQIGATDDAEKATVLLDRAKRQGAGFLGAARPVTEKIRKGDATLYRARFAGLGTAEAEQACRALRRSGFACFTVKD